MLSCSTTQKLGAVKNNPIIKEIREYFIKLKPKIKHITSLPNESLEKDYYKPIKIIMLLTVNISNIKAKEMRIKHYHLKNILM